MNNNFNNHDFDDERTHDIQQGNQNIELNLEQLLTQLILNPSRLKTAKINLVDSKGNTIAISQSHEENATTPSGFPQELTSEDTFVFDDGLSLHGITVCQTCGGVVNENNIIRCKCGQTCCIRRGCAKYSKSKGEWYCCWWHKIIGGFFGFNLR